MYNNVLEFAFFMLKVDLKELSHGIIYKLHFTKLGTNLSLISFWHHVDDNGVFG